MIPDEIRKLLKEKYGIEVYEIDRDIMRTITINLRLHKKLSDKQIKEVESLFESKIWPKGYKRMQFPNNGGFKNTELNIKYYITAR